MFKLFLIITLAIIVARFIEGILISLLSPILKKFVETTTKKKWSTKQ